MHSNQVDAPPPATLPHAWQRRPDGMEPGVEHDILNRLPTFRKKLLYGDTNCPPAFIGLGVTQSVQHAVDALTRPRDAQTDAARRAR